MNKTVNLTIDGLGIALFSAKTMDYVEPGSDFFTNEFEAPQQIAEHIRKGDITAFLHWNWRRFLFAFFNRSTYC